MEHLHHDAMTKTIIKEKLYTFIYMPVINTFKNRLESIIVRNAVISGYSHKSFVYKGELYSCDTASPPRKANRLSVQLKMEMDDYLKDIKELNNKEIPMVLGFINQVLNTSDRLSDYLRVLPESIHRPLEDLINACPCRSLQMTDTEVSRMKQQNKSSIDLLKQRLIINLLT